MAASLIIMLIDILIPTFNRSDDLQRNLRLLTNQIKSDNLQSVVRILISDNFSTDNTKEQVENFVSTSEASGIEIVYSRNNRNIGLESNVVRLLELATSDFVLWIGDDDYLADGYLDFLVKAVEQRPLLGCIIPGLASLYEDGTLKPGRVENYAQHVIEAGFDGVLQFSHLGHQMSGLLVRREGLLDEYLNRPDYRNPYLFIYFVSSRMLRYESIYAPKFPTRVTVFNAKDWGYNGIGLLDEVFKNYLALGNRLPIKNIEDLLLRFAVVHSYRLAFRPLKPVILSRQYHVLIKAGTGSLRFKLQLASFFAKEAVLSLAGR